MKQPETGKHDEHKRAGSEPKPDEIQEEIRAHKAEEDRARTEEDRARRAEEERRARREEDVRAAYAPGEERGSQAADAAGRTIGAAGTAVRTGITGSLRGIDEIESDIVSLVRNTVSNTLRATGAVGY